MCQLHVGTYVSTFVHTTELSAVVQMARQLKLMHAANALALYLGYVGDDLKVVCKNRHCWSR